MYAFEHTEYLWALGGLIIPLLLFLYYIRWKRQVIRKNKFGPALAKLTQHYAPAAFYSKFLLFFLALALLIGALANWQQPGKGINMQRKGIDLVFALDISKSMLAEDIKPSRLERAKLLINRIIEAWPDNRTGLVVFAGKAYLQMPLTFDYAAARTIVNNAGPESAPTAGTAIGEALYTSGTVFSTSEKKYRAVILITDGEDHGKNAVAEARKLKDSGAILITVGLGSEQGAPIIDPLLKDFKKDAAGQTVISKLNVPLLKEMAATANGIYVHYTETAEVLNIIKKKLDGLGTTTLPDKSIMNFNSRYHWFLLAALFLLLAELLIKETRRIKKPVTAALAFLFILPATAQNNRELARGNQWYIQGEYEKAAAEYEKAREKNKTDYRAWYNLGNTLYRQQNYKTAADNYNAAKDHANNNTEKAAALYNRGTALARGKELAAAVAAFKQSLKLNPASADCRFNLAKALKELEKQQKDKTKNNAKNKTQPRSEISKAPPPRKSKLSNTQLQQILQAIRKKEKQVQARLKENGVPGIMQPDKDW
jgi:Ca-activated chloride channel homolog